MRNGADICEPICQVAEDGLAVISSEGIVILKGTLRQMDYGQDPVTIVNAYRDNHPFHFIDVPASRPASHTVEVIPSWTLRELSVQHSWGYIGPR